MSLPARRGGCPDGEPRGRGASAADGSRGKPRDDPRVGANTQHGSGEHDTPALSRSRDARGPGRACLGLPLPTENLLKRVARGPLARNSEPSDWLKNSNRPINGGHVAFVISSGENEVQSRGFSTKDHGSQPLLPICGRDSQNHRPSVRVAVEKIARVPNGTGTCRAPNEPARRAYSRDEDVY